MRRDPKTDAGKCHTAENLRVAVASPELSLEGAADSLSGHAERGH
jgi:hypothetical protein